MYSIKPLKFEIRSIGTSIESDIYAAPFFLCYTKQKSIRGNRDRKQLARNKTLMFHAPIEISSSE